MEDVHTDKNTQKKWAGKKERLRERLKAMEPSEGNPHVYDNVFKTMTIRVPKWNIPMVNEFFGTHYSMEDDVEYLYNVETSVFNSFRIKDRLPDSKFKMGDRRYHLECESNPNGDIAIRLFEYDWMDAVNFVEREEAGSYVVRVQNSALLYLRSNENTPEQFTYKLVLPGGEEAVYQVPVIRNPDYSLKEIFEKQLYMMLPYYILKYEQKTEEMDGSIENEKEKAEAEDRMKELLGGDLEAIEKELNRRVKEHMIREYDKVLLLQLMWDVSKQAFVKRTAMKGRVDEFMGGQVLEYAWETEYRRQLKEAEDEGRLEGELKGRTIGSIEGANRKIISQICRKLTKNKSVGMIAEELEEDDIEYIQHICEVAKKYAPDYDADRIYGELYPESETE